MLGFYPLASKPFGSNGALGAYTFSASNGSYAITGQSATLLRSKALTGDFGAYTTTGVPAVITYSGGPGPVVVTDQLLITLRSFTERRRF